MGRTARTRRKRKKGWLVLLVIITCAAAVLWIAVPRLEQQTYPLKYEHQIALNADLYGIDPYLVAAVIRTESGFDPQAVSSAGARGLMQLMPETGQWIASKLDVSEYTDDLLFQPDINIQFGCWYLSFLEDRFDGKHDLVAAAYNAGHNRVSEWLGDESISTEGELTNIPYRETSKYVARVSDAEQKYKKYYPHAFVERARS